jgi:hypothetical protein
VLLGGLSKQTKFSSNTFPAKQISIQTHFNSNRFRSVQFKANKSTSYQLGSNQLGICETSCLLPGDAVVGKGATVFQLLSYMNLKPSIEQQKTMFVVCLGGIEGSFFL